MPSVIFIHPAVWPQQIRAENWGLCPFWGRELGLHLTQCGQGPGLYLRGKFLRVRSPDQQCQSAEGSTSPKDRLQSHQVHLTMLQYYTVHMHAMYTK